MNERFCRTAKTIFLALACAGPLHAQTLGAAFSYQGQLMDSGVPANGLYDLQACLFDGLVSTTLLACAAANEDVPVAGGLFSVALDFGTAPFVGQQRYLELRVRQGASSGSFTVLSPRQLIRALPEALRANSAPWTGLSAVPAGFVDGVDNIGVSSVSAGTGLSGGTITSAGTIAIAAGGVNATMIAPGAVGAAHINTAQVQSRVSGSCGDGEYFRGINGDGSLDCELLPVNFDRVVDSSGDVGKYVSLALRSDGRPVLAYHEDDNGALRLYDCADPACANGTRRTLDSANDVGEDTSVAIGPSGFPVVVYRDVTGQALKLYDCANTACSSGTPRTLDSSVNVAQRSTAMALRADGRAFIAYYDLSNSVLKAYDCANENCSSGAVRSFSGVVPSGVSVAIRSDGRPLIAVGGNAGAGTLLRLVDCNDVACTSWATRALGAVSVAFPALAIRADGRPLLASAGVGQQLTAYDCADVLCATHVRTFLAASPSAALSLKLRGNGFAMIANGRSIAADASDLRVFDCANSGCSSGSSRTVVGNGDFGTYVALALRGDGRPVLAFYDALNGDLRLRVCANPECT